MSMRDKIAEICSTGARWRDKGEYVIADAILSALPDMIAPLVWEAFSASCRSEKTSIGSQYFMSESRSGGSVCVTVLNQGNSHTIGYFPHWDKAEAAANTHHRAAIMAAFKGETTT
tara:strand:- start:1220 stop:1567 length:348 start_codon:yes stop_codon:yes gene_type:complete